VEKTIIKSYGLLVLSFYLCCSAYTEFSCEVSREHPEVKRTIQLCEELENRIQTVKLTYTSVIEENYPGGTNGTFQLDFIYSGDNYLLIITQPVKDVTISNIKQELSEISRLETDKPKNILEEFLYNRIQKIYGQQEKKSLTYYDFASTYEYFYKGKYTRYQLFSKGEETNTIPFPQGIVGMTPFVLQYKDPRILWGKGGIIYVFKESGGEEIGDIPVTFSDFLKTDGKYNYKEEGGYKILWHEAQLEDKNIYQYDFWIDNEDRIIKCRSVSKLYFILNSEERPIAENILGQTITCDSYEFVNREWNFSRFHPQLKIPLEVEQISYKTEIKKEEENKFEQIFQEKEQGKISRAEYIARTLPMNNTPFIFCHSRILVHENSLRVNEPIDENTFISPVKPPEETLEETEKQSRFPWYRRYTGVIFVGGCIAFTLILMFLTRRYLGWGM